MNTAKSCCTGRGRCGSSLAAATRRLRRACSKALLVVQINRAGQLIDLERNKRKIIILQKEFQKAEAAQLRKRKEEDDIREKVRKERFTLIEEIKRDELRRRIRDDRSIRREIVRIGLQAQGTLTSRIIRQPRSRNGQMSSLSEKKPTFAFAKADNVSMRTGKGDGSTLAKVSRESLSGDARKKRDLCEESCG
mmetsp:Transcript_58/g.309  ORF Transcript_58/g.309 Transcript_58/m.309 type:complete len:193 (-) Transcript_58:1607-2185(-)